MIFEVPGALCGDQHRYKMALDSILEGLLKRLERNLKALGGHWERLELSLSALGAILAEHVTWMCMHVHGTCMELDLL